MFCLIGFLAVTAPLCSDRPGAWCDESEGIFSLPKQQTEDEGHCLCFQSDFSDGKACDILSEEEMKFHVRDNLNYVKIHKHTPPHNGKQWLFLDGRTMSDTFFFFLMLFCFCFVMF